MNKVKKIEVKDVTDMAGYEPEYATSEHEREHVCGEPQNVTEPTVVPCC